MNVLRAVYELSLFVPHPVFKCSCVHHRRIHSSVILEYARFASALIEPEQDIRAEQPGKVAEIPFRRQCRQVYPQPGSGSVELVGRLSPCFLRKGADILKDGTDRCSLLISFSECSGCFYDNPINRIGCDARRDGIAQHPANTLLQKLIVFPLGNAELGA